MLGRWLFEACSLPLAVQERTRVPFNDALTSVQSTNGFTYSCVRLLFLTVRRRHYAARFCSADCTLPISPSVCSSQNNRSERVRYSLELCRNPSSQGNAPLDQKGHGQTESWRTQAGTAATQGDDLRSEETIIYSFSVLTYSRFTYLLIAVAKR